jgi:hypothetical protein
MTISRPDALMKDTEGGMSITWTLNIDRAVSVRLDLKRELEKGSFVVVKVETETKTNDHRFRDSVTTHLVSAMLSVEALEVVQKFLDCRSNNTNYEIYNRWQGGHFLSGKECRCRSKRRCNACKNSEREQLFKSRILTVGP